MLYNLDWLKPGQIFPPRCELPRLKSYEDNRNLFNGDVTKILFPYVSRIREMVNEMKEKDHEDMSFINIPNYWQLTSIKTADLLAGDAPTFDMPEVSKEKFEESNIIPSLTEMVYDLDMFGDTLVRIYKDEKHQKKFVLMNPSSWFPIVDSETPKRVLAHCFAWIVCVRQDANNPTLNRYELNVQIHTIGKSKYISRRYKVASFYLSNYFDDRTKEIIQNSYTFVIGRLLEEKEVETATGDCDILHCAGITTSASIHGISNYDRITELCAEIMVREALANYILDKNSAPRLAAPESAFTQNKEGRWVLKTGGRSFVIGEGSQIPIYVTWDGSLENNERAIERLRKELITMSEMSSIINDDDLNSSQGYDALEIKMTNPKLKVRRIATKLTPFLKELVSKLCDCKIKDVSILFNDGLPDNEMREIEKATAKKQLGYSFRTIGKEYFGMSDEDVDEELERRQEELALELISQFGVSERNRTQLDETQ